MSGAYDRPIAMGMILPTKTTPSAFELSGTINLSMNRDDFAISKIKIYLT